MEVPVYLCTEINQERATCTFLSFLHTKMKVYVQTFFGKIRKTYLELARKDLYEKTQISNIPQKLVILVSK